MSTRERALGSTGEEQPGCDRRTAVVGDQVARGQCTLGGRGSYELLVRADLVGVQIGEGGVRRGTVEGRVVPVVLEFLTLGEPKLPGLVANAQVAVARPCLKLL